MKLNCLLFLSCLLYRVQGMQDVHKLMSVEELRHYFGVDQEHLVQPHKYQVSIVFNTLHIEREISKRSGDTPPEAAYKVAVFGNTYNLRLKRNRNLLAANLTYTEVDGPRTKDVIINNTGRLSVMEMDDSWGFSNCDHFVGLSAAISDCGEGIRGFLFDNETYEIYPIPKRLQEMLNISSAFLEGEGEGEGVPHLVKMADFPPDDVIKDQFRGRLNVAHLHNKIKRDDKSGEKLYIETALFLDAAAYRNYRSFYESSGSSDPDTKIRDLLLCYMNSIQAMYNFPSLGQPIDFSLVKLEIQKTQPAELPSYDGERGGLLTSFCNYQGKNNPSGDDNPSHWDIGLLVSGLDFWSQEGSQKSYLTMGLSTVTGVCTNTYGCVIGELGVRSPEGKPYPSTGFTAVYVMVHEIGHNLGMSHDSTGNACEADGFIMSPSRGTKGETAWSSCSRSVVTSLNMECLKDKPVPMEDLDNHNKYNNYPGQEWDADAQCKQMLFDNDAKMDHNNDNINEICYSLMCRSPNKIGYYRAGPALEGTPCGNSKICQGGQCVTNTISPGVVSTATWSDWSFSSCQSGCITRSKGFVTKSRSCIKNTPVSVSSTCAGNSKEVSLCDNPQCQGYEVVSTFADRQCNLFQQASSRLKAMIRPLGKQPQYNKDRVDLACTIHCRMTKTGGWYAPVLELNDLAGLSVYFPDGTWCNHDGETDYFCRMNRCVSSSRGARADKVPDLGVSNNAHPNGEYNIPKEVETYFTLNEQGVPLSSNTLPKNNNEAVEKDWQVIDYINIL